MRYLVKVGSTFHYRRRVPDDIRELLGKDWWKQSLKTSSERQAEENARPLAVKHDRIIKELRSAPTATRTALLAAQLQLAIEGIDAEIEAEVQLTTEGKWIRVADPKSVATVKKAERFKARLKQSLLEAAEQGMSALSPDQRALVKKAGGVESFVDSLKQKVDHVAGSQRTLKLRQALPEEFKQNLAPLDEEMLQAALDIDSRRLALAFDVVEKLGIAPLGFENAEDPNNPRINSVLTDWFDDRKQRPEAVRRHRVAIRRFVELFGNISVQQITRDMVESYIKAIENLTDHRLLPAKDRGGLVSVDGIPKVSAPTVNRHLITIKAFLTFCVEKGWVLKNVAIGLEAPKDTRPKAARRRAMVREELKQLLKRAVAEYGKDSDRVWLIKVAAYTGTRLEEAAQLARKNVKLIDGTWVFELDDLDGRLLKNDSSVRNVPIHSAIRKDFLAWLKKTDKPGRDRVFMTFQKYDGRFSNKLSGDMARLMDRAGITDPRVVMHSMRHTLKTAMADAGIEGEYRRLILGHKPRDVHEADYERPSIGTIAREFEKMKPLI